MCLQQSRGVARAEIRIDDAISGARGSMAATGWTVFDPLLCVADAADIIKAARICSNRACSDSIQRLAMSPSQRWAG